MLVVLMLKVGTSDLVSNDIYNLIDKILEGIMKILNKLLPFLSFIIGFGLISLGVWSVISGGVIGAILAIPAIGFGFSGVGLAIAVGLLNETAHEDEQFQISEYCTKNNEVNQIKETVKTKESYVAKVKNEEKCL